MQSHYTIGFAGHVDHGKTTLVRCLTGVDTDRKPEEKLRGMSIEAGVAPLNLPSGRQVAVIDVPGHTDFLKNTIRGLNSVDVGILVVAADDGVMPQTREHLELLKFFKASSGFVVLSKTDLVDPDTVELAELEVRELLNGTFLENRPFFRFSVKNPKDSTDIVHGIDASLNGMAPKKPVPPFRLWIDQVRNLTGHGTVVSGTISSGSILCDDKLELLPSGKIIRARSLETHGSAIEKGAIGMRVGINLHRASIHDVERGMALATPGAICPASFLNADIHILDSAASALKNRQKVKVYLGTAITSASIILMARERLAPGESGLVQLRLARPMAVLPQDAFVVTPLNANRVIAGGRILESTREKFRAVKSQSMVPLLSVLRKADIDAYLEGVFARPALHLITARDLASKTGLPLSRFESRISAKVQKKELVYIKGQGAVKTSQFSALKARFLSVVEETFSKNPLKKAILMSEVVERLEIPPANNLLAIVAEELCGENKLIRLHGGYNLPDANKPLDERREALVLRLLEYATHCGVAPFSADTFWKQHRMEFEKEEIEQLLNYLFFQNKIVRLNDHRFLSLEALDEIKQRVTRTIDLKGFITVNDCKEILGYGRWGGTHVLDHLNRIGFTVRREDKHYLKKSRL
jgi:selenocysteine-specific elongation factor